MSRNLRRSLRTSVKLAKVGWNAVASAQRPILVHLVPIRRCNLSCTYCNEYDKHSPPVPSQEMLRRIDKLAALGTSMVSLSGGEPLLHPDLELLIARIVSHDMLAELLTNAFLLTADRIHALNRARLDRMQISIDNLIADQVSHKSLKVLDKKLQLLAEHADFGVNINSVVGAGIPRPQDALTIAKRARELGFSSTVGLIHDHTGRLRPLSETESAVYEQVKRLGGTSLAPFTRFKDNLAAGKPNHWRCRAGARYLYICEEGLVHYCSQQRGRPGIKLANYAIEDLKREFDAEKPCAPYCTINCVHAVALFDNWRRRQRAVASLPEPLPDS